MLLQVSDTKISKTYSLFHKIKRNNRSFVVLHKKPSIYVISYLRLAKVYTNLSQVQTETRIFYKFFCTNPAVALRCQCVLPHFRNFFLFSAFPSSFFKWVLPIFFKQKSFLPIFFQCFLPIFLQKVIFLFFLQKVSFLFVSVFFSLFFYKNFTIFCVSFLFFRVFFWRFFLKNMRMKLSRKSRKGTLRKKRERKLFIEVFEGNSWRKRGRKLWRKKEEINFL